MLLPRDPADRWLLAWTLGAVAFGAASLLVPLYLIQQGGGAIELGLLAGTAGFAGALGAILLGAVSDRQDDRPTIFVGSLAVIAVCLAAFVVVEGTAALIAVNALLWLTVAAATPTLTLIVIDDAPQFRWQDRIAALSRAQGVGWAAGLALGFAWMLVVPAFLSPAAAYGTFFLAMAVAAGGAAVAGKRWIPREAGRPIGAAAERRILRFVLRQGRELSGTVLFLAPTRLFATAALLRPRRIVHRFTRPLAFYFAAALLFFTGFGMYFALLPLFLRATVGLGEGVVFGLFFVSNASAALFFTRAGGLAADRSLTGLVGGMLGARAVIFPAVGFGGIALGTAGAGVAFLALAFLLTGLSWAVIAVAGTTLVTNLAPDGIRGEALGIYTALNTAAGGIGSFIGGWLAAQGTVPFFGTVALCCLGAALMVAALAGSR